MAIPHNDIVDHFNKSSGESDFIKRIKKDTNYDSNVETDSEMKKFYQKFKGTTSTRNSSFKPYGVYDFQSNIQKSSLSEQFSENANKRMITPYTFDKILMNEDGTMKSGGEMMDQLVLKAQEETYQQLQDHYELKRKINQETSLTGKLSKDWRTEIMNATPELLRVGVTFEEISESMVTLIKDAGRFKLISTETIESVGKTGKVFFDNMDSAVLAISEFQKVSKGAADAMESIKDVGIESLNLGLNAKETVKSLTENIEKLNQYGFKNGEKGLARMIRQSQELKMSMEGAFKIAEDVMDPSKALDLAANLQVIGGAIGDFNDPIKMMYMATNDVEGLQNALIGTYETLVSFDEESQTFKVMGADLRRARALSQELGVSLEDVTNTAVQAAQRTSAAADLMTTGLDIPEDEKEFLINLAQMKGGKMVIEVPDNLRDAIGAQTDGLVELDNMSQDQYKALIAYQDQIKELSQDKSLDDLTREQVGLTENIYRELSFIAATIRVKGDARIQKMAEDFGIADQTNFKRQLAGYADVMADTLKSGIDYVAEAGTNVGMEAKKAIEAPDKSNTTTQPTQSQMSTTQNKNVNIRITSSISMDESARKIANDTIVKDKDFRSFLYREYYGN